jgi:hypothetical protein
VLYPNQKESARNIMIFHLIMPYHWGRFFKFVRVYQKSLWLNSGKELLSTSKLILNTQFYRFPKLWLKVKMSKVKLVQMSKIAEYKSRNLSRPHPHSYILTFTIIFVFDIFIFRHFYFRPIDAKEKSIY